MRCVPAWLFCPKCGLDISLFTKFARIKKNAFSSEIICRQNGKTDKILHRTDYEIDIKKSCCIIVCTITTLI